MCLKVLRWVQHSYLNKRNKVWGFPQIFAARNLAAYPEGRAKVWKHFIEELDQADFTQDEQDRVIYAAQQAFDYFGALLKDIHST